MWGTGKAAREEENFLKKVFLLPLQNLNHTLPFYRKTKNTIASEAAMTATAMTVMRTERV